MGQIPIIPIGVFKEYFYGSYLNKNLSYHENRKKPNYSFTVFFF